MIAGLLGVLALPSCKKDFLDQDSTEMLLPRDIDKAAVWNADIYPGQVNGIMSTLYLAQQGSASRNDVDYGQRGFDVFADIYSGDLEVSATNFGHYTAESKRETYEARYLSNYLVWRETFLTIQGSNRFLASIGGDQNEPTAEDQKVYWARCMAMRSYGYLRLISFYTKPYSDATKGNAALPLYTSGVEDGKTVGLSTLEETYQFVIDGLQKAYTAFTNAAQSQNPEIRNLALGGGIKEPVSLNIVRGLLARTYLAKGDYANALKFSKELIDTGEYPLLTTEQLTTDGFNSVNNPEFIWAVDITKDNSGGLFSFWAHVDYYTYGYAALGDIKVINGYLQQEMLTNHPNDLRNDWFVHDSKESDINKAPLNGMPYRKFFSAIGIVDGHASDRSFEQDIHFMRIAEFYLTAAEAAARSNNDAEAKNYLLALLRNRTKADAMEAETARINGLSHTDLLEELYYNWRVEMWGEGFSLDVQKRFQKKSRRSTRSQYFADAEVDYTDPSLYYEIPRNEVRNNQLIK